MVTVQEFLSSRDYEKTGDWTVVLVNGSVSMKEGELTAIRSSVSFCSRCKYYKSTPIGTVSCAVNPKYDGKEDCLDFSRIELPNRRSSSSKARYNRVRRGDKDHPRG